MPLFKVNRDGQQGCPLLDIVFPHNRVSPTNSRLRQNLRDVSVPHSVCLSAYADDIVLLISENGDVKTISMNN